ncbi:MAG: STM4011 family radical SAM protein [Pirellulales bacterium]|nr:STM4011 family radical SAM protein [Pirellulales bacterium]
MGIELSILYRGPLSSCNYDCHYCPFAKHHETAAELAEDRRRLERFVNWVCDRPADDRLSVFFTPWGEALTRSWYRDAIVTLSHAPHIEKVAVQTNLSCRLAWLEQCRTDRVGLWCTYHPSQTSRSEFLKQCQQLDRLEVKYSVGVVGLKEDFGEIERLRRELTDDVYLWVNAYKDVDDYYDNADIERLELIDPLFRINNARHTSLGRSCRAGEAVVSVDGNGDMRRCHFIKSVIGNIYDNDFGHALTRRPCTNATCGCHIGYVHLEHLQLDGVFGDGILERVPDQNMWHVRGAEEARRWATSLMSKGAQRLGVEHAAAD